MCQCLTSEQFGFVLALFYHHQLAPYGFTDDWPLSSRFTPHAPRGPPLGPAGSGRAQTLPAGYCLTPTADLAKTERGPIATSGPLFQYGTKPGERCGKIHPFFLARRRPTVDHSIAAGGAVARSLSGTSDLDGSGAQISL